MIESDQGCAVITGGSSGIGLALARELIGQGTPVVLVGRDASRAEAAASELRADGGHVLAIACDVGDREAVTALAERVRTEMGPVELLALNAAVTTAGPLLDHIPRDWDWVFSSVLHGVVNGVQSFVADMVARGRGRECTFGGRPPAYFGFSESKPSALKLWVTSRTRSALVNVTSAICGTAMLWAASSTICARRQVTTQPLLRRTMHSSWLPSSLLIVRACTRWTISHLLRRRQDQTR